MANPATSMVSAEAFVRVSRVVMWSDEAFFFAAGFNAPLPGVSFFPEWGDGCFREAIEGV